ncbi:MAG: hypothetical protein J6X70_08335 [Muribaculaceae bacterium]|nr:hypothetical protein [Muribaculaceae bacterium]
MKVSSVLFFISAVVYVCLAVINVSQTSFPVSSTMMLYLIDAIFKLLILLPLIQYLIISSPQMPLKNHLLFYVIVNILEFLSPLFMNLGLIDGAGSRFISQIILVLASVVLFIQLMRYSKFNSIIWWLSLLCLVSSFYPVSYLVLSAFWEGDPQGQINMFFAFVALKDLAMASLMISVGVFLWPQREYRSKKL